VDKFLLLKVRRSVLLESGGHGDGRHHCHAGPLLRLLKIKIYLKITL